MYTQIEKPKENKSREVANSVLQKTKTTQTTFGFSSSAPIQMGREGLEFGNFGRDGKRKGQKVIRMEEFGDHNRIHNLDPNKIETDLDEDIKGMQIRESDIDKKLGIWRPSIEEGTARPEDPPIYQPFRVAFHDTHNILLSLRSDIGDFKVFDKQHQFTERLLDIASTVKKVSINYKAQLRNFNNKISIADLKGWYFEELDELTRNVTNLSVEIIDNYKKSSQTLRDLDTKTLMEMKSKDGVEIWRKNWWAAIQESNRILELHWTLAKGYIKDWMVDNKKKENLNYMNENMIGDLDYIGSLAKGYKSAPKQYIRFLPEKFDIDANLDAPPLAAYSISQGLTVDRGSVGSKKIEPLKEFESEVWKELKKIPGIDLGDPFEVFIRADNVTDLMHGLHPHVDMAHKEERLSKRLQDVQNRIWNLKTKDPRYVDFLKTKLSSYINEDGTIKSRKLNEFENSNTKKYQDDDLTVIEYHLTKAEKNQRPKEYSENGKIMQKVLELDNKVNQVRSGEILSFWDSKKLIIEELEQGLSILNNTEPLELLNWDTLELLGPDSLVHPNLNPHTIDMIHNNTRTSINYTLAWLKGLPL